MYRRIQIDFIFTLQIPKSSQESQWPFLKHKMHLSEPNSSCTFWVILNASTQTCRQWNENSEQLTFPFFLKWPVLRLWRRRYILNHGVRSNWAKQLATVGKVVWSQLSSNPRARHPRASHYMGSRRVVPLFFCWWLNSPRTDTYWPVIETGPQL